MGTYSSTSIQHSQTLLIHETVHYPAPTSKQSQSSHTQGCYSLKRGWGADGEAQLGASCSEEMMGWDLYDMYSLTPGVLGCCSGTWKFVNP